MSVFGCEMPCDGLASNFKYISALFSCDSLWIHSNPGHSVNCDKEKNSTQLM